MADQEMSGEGFGGTRGTWTAFHQAYDSAVRAHRRGGDVSRAVNWLYVMSRDSASEDDREMERHNREIGLRLGSDAKSEVDIAPSIWQAVQSGELATTPRRTLYSAQDSGEGSFIELPEGERTFPDRDETGRQISPPEEEGEPNEAVPNTPEPGGKEPERPRQENKNPDWEYIL